jgi:hypothetical protein
VIFARVERHRELDRLVRDRLVGAQRDLVALAPREERVIHLHHHRADALLGERVVVAEDAQHAPLVGRVQVDHVRLGRLPLGLVLAAALEAPARAVLVLEPLGAVVVARPAVDHAEVVLGLLERLAVHDDLLDRHLPILVLLAQHGRDAVDVGVELGEDRAVDADVDLALLERGVGQVDGAEHARLLAVLAPEIGDVEADRGHARDGRLASHGERGVAGAPDVLRLVARADAHERQRLAPVRVGLALAPVAARLREPLLGRALRVGLARGLVDRHRLEQELHQLVRDLVEQRLHVRVGTARLELDRLVLDQLVAHLAEAAADADVVERDLRLHAERLVLLHVVPVDHEIGVERVGQPLERHLEDQRDVGRRHLEALEQERRAIGRQIERERDLAALEHGRVAGREQARLLGAARIDDRRDERVLALLEDHGAAQLDVLDLHVLLVLLGDEPLQRALGAAHLLLGRVVGDEEVHDAAALGLRDALARVLLLRARLVDHVADERERGQAGVARDEARRARHVVVVERIDRRREHPQSFDARALVDQDLLRARRERQRERHQQRERSRERHGPPLRGDRHGAGGAPPPGAGALASAPGSGGSTSR